MRVFVNASASHRGSCLGYCYGSEHREAASWRQELGQIWQILDYTFFFYDQKQIKSAENKRRVLGVFIQKLISVRSGRGLQPTSSLSPCQLYNLWLFLFKYKLETYSNASSPFKRLVAIFRLEGEECFKRWFQCWDATSCATDRHLSRTLRCSSSGECFGVAS